MAPCTHKRKNRDGISHRDTPTAEAQHSEDRKERKISKNIAARSAIAARIRQEHRNQRRLAKPAALNSKDAETDGDVGMKADKEGEDEDLNDNVDKAMDILQDQNEDKERNEDKRRGSRGAGSTWEIPIR
ncbi:hypothetical protein BTUL_0026g00210 [Botrytis tulipae]|uniref:Uncharacterized protein n=1 Tax=Botrytis tulipae TaxID=87230 RepID=A0A4Z1EZ30_9HELO|nr:hypothetical protein BTUL_0026g00210 [Botrytis tulipae]